MKTLILAGGAFSVIVVDSDKKVAGHHPEIVGLLLMVVAGAMLLVSANHMALAYIAFEMLSVPSYALVGSIKGDSKSTEGGLKYAVFGGAASAFMLYGISIVYGLTGSMSLSASPAALNSAAGVLAALFIFAGMMYKLAAAPFHYWCPDAFEGGPTSVAAFLSVVPKIAGFGLLFSLSFALSGSRTFSELLGAAALISMTFGNLAALHQTNVKRLLAYSSVAHAGYMLVAASLMTGHGQVAVVYYLLVYVVMNVGAFYVTGLVSDSGDILAFRALGKRNAFLALCMTIFLFSLTGLPPFGGFVGKLLIISAALEGRAFLLVFALVVNTAISLYYYARIVREMYVESAESVEEIGTHLVPEIVLVTMISLIICFGLYWQPPMLRIMTAWNVTF
jgi:NADH-quinone oxidoreductase subunit N